MMEVGVIGTGFMGGTHVDRYAGIEGVSVAAVAAPNSAADFVEDRGLEAVPYHESEQLFDDERLDAVDICTPTGTHRKFIEAAADRHLDVFCEKPLTHRADDLPAIRQAVEDAGITCMVGHVVRFFPEYAAIKAQVEDDAIGDIGTVRARRHIPPPAWAEWYHDERRSGGVLVDLAIHDFDYLRWVLGDVDRVFARTRSWDDHQHAQAMLRFAGGQIGYVEASSALPPGQALRTELELAGEHGLIDHTSRENEPLRLARSTGGDDDIGNIPPNPVDEDGFYRELDAFVRSITRGDPPPVTLEEGIEAVRLSLAAVRSADIGEPVKPSEVAL